MRSILLLLLLLLLLLILTALAAGSSAAKARHYKWDVEYIYWSPDCEERVVMAINGQFPGPTIRAHVGDTIQVDLTNKLGIEGVVIHWHGIRQIDTPWADGTASISQCAINPGETFTYRFKVDKAGTYFYHGHYGMQRSAGLYGSLIVEVAPGQTEPFHYDAEFNLLLSDWWHNSTLNQEVGLNSVPFRFVGEPQTLLVNGRGQYYCSLAPNFANSSSTQCNFTGNEQCAPQILVVEPNKTYRIRLASTTALASLNFQIGNHKLTVVEADGNYVTPFTVDDMDIYSGESYSVLLHTDQDPSTNYWISFGVRGRLPKTQPALTILNYKTVSRSTLLPAIPPPVTPPYNDFNHSKAFTKQIVSLMGSPIPPPKFDRQIKFLNTQNKLNGHIKWAINNVSLVLSTTPSLGSLRFGLKSAFSQVNPPEDFSPSYDITVPAVNPNTTQGNGVYRINYNTTVDIILQNANALAPNTSEVHPWHLHGHDFWVLGYGEGMFTAGDEATFNLKNPPLRNTAVIFPYGWTALRFVADNPGAWAFHCHIEPHLHMGMGVVLGIAVERVKGIPAKALSCGVTGKMFLKKKYLP